MLCYNSNTNEHIYFTQCYPRNRQLRKCILHTLPADEIQGMLRPTSNDSNAEVALENLFDARNVDGIQRLAAQPQWHQNY